MKIESVILIVKNIDKDTSNGINSEKVVTLSTPLPNMIMLGGSLLAIFGIIVLGYLKGNMHLLTTLKNAREAL